jgi:tetratricopeptide (TPR) repeat protein
MFLQKAGWAIGACVLFSASLALAQVTALTGVVIGEDGKPLRDAVIKIERTDIKGHYTTKSGKRGDYYHGGLPLGNYNLTVEVDGRVMDTVRGVRTSTGEPRPINFNLQEVKQRQEALAKAAESGTLTKEQARQLSPEQRAALEKNARERQLVGAKMKSLNDAFNSGMEAFQAKQWELAIESLKKAGEVDPSQRAVWQNLAEAQLQLAMTRSGPERESTFNLAFETYQKWISMDPTSAAAHDRYGLALARARKYAEAQVEMEKAAALDPAQAGRGYYNLGAELVNGGQYEAGAVMFQKAIELTPTYAEAHYQYAVCLSAKMTIAADGKIVAPPGLREELLKYLELAPAGPNAQAAKDMLALVDAQLQTRYVNPNAPPPPAKKPKKK